MCDRDLSERERAIQRRRHKAHSHAIYTIRKRQVTVSDVEDVQSHQEVRYPLPYRHVCDVKSSGWKAKLRDLA